MSGSELYNDYFMQELGLIKKKKEPIPEPECLEKRKQYYRERFAGQPTTQPMVIQPNVNRPMGGFGHFHLYIIYFLLVLLIVLTCVNLSMTFVLITNIMKERVSI